MKLLWAYISLLLIFQYNLFGFKSQEASIGYFSEATILYDGNLVSAELDIRDGAQKLIRKYTWGLDPAGTRQEVGGIGALVGMETFNADGSSQKHHVVSDAGGNVTAVLTSNDDDSVSVANTYEYGPFGQTIAKEETVEIPYQFNTKYNDIETGLVYYGFRYYDAKDGRWLNSDPIGVNGGINTYNSVSNDMVNGFAGGMSWSGGMERDSGYRVSNNHLDSYGRVTSFSIDINNYLGKKAGTVKFTYEKYNVITGFGDKSSGAQIKGGFNFIPGGLNTRVEFQCEELRWIQVFYTNRQGGVWGDFAHVDPVQIPLTGNQKIDKHNNQNYDSLPFYNGGVKEGMQKSNGYEAYFQDNPARGWRALTYDNSIVRWRAELALVAVNTTKNREKKWKPIKVFKYGFMLSKSYDIVFSYSRTVATPKEIISKRRHVLSPSRIQTSDKPSARFQQTLNKFLGK